MPELYWLRLVFGTALDLRSLKDYGGQPLVFYPPAFMRIRVTKDTLNDELVQRYITMGMLAFEWDDTLGPAGPPAPAPVAPPAPPVVATVPASILAAEDAPADDAPVLGAVLDTSNTAAAADAADTDVATPADPTADTAAATTFKAKNPKRR